VKHETKCVLDELGRKGETYDDIIRKLISFYRNGQSDNNGHEEKNSILTVKATEN
jgi:hypothetical protein